jgi:hypothetical protein
MPNIIQINSISGTSPYNVYVCDITLTSCFPVFSGSVTIVPPLQFIVPPPLDNVLSLILKIVDSLGCEKFILLSCGTLYGKQFEDFEVFMFQDDVIYLFEGP